MAYATATDVEARFTRALDTDETRVVDTRLGDAELIIKSEIPDLDTQVTDGIISQPVLVMIEADMVLRLIKNPEGYTQENDGAYGYSISARVASGVLEVLPSEWALLGKSQGAYTIAPQVKLPWTSDDGTVVYDVGSAVLYR